MENKTADKAQLIDSLIRPLRVAEWQADFRWKDLDEGLGRLANGYGGIEMCPDFQRGHVWSDRQQTHFIENCLRGVVPKSGFLIQLNCPQWAENCSASVETDLPGHLQCVDGLQRYTAVMRFVKDEITPFGLSVNDLAGTSYAPDRIFMNVAVHCFTKRADLLEHYLSINTGGTPHSAEEIERVRDLLALAKAAP